MQKTWTEIINTDDKNLDQLLTSLCSAFNHSPFLAHNQIQMRVNATHQIEAYMQMQPHLLGNTAFAILHGGVTATLLDSIGGINAMAFMYQQADAAQLEQVAKKIKRLATLDLRVDYLQPGRGEYFIAQADCLRMGNKSCLMRMDLHNQGQEHIATAVASYMF